MIMNSRDKRWLALAVVCMGQLMMILDATIVAVALPAIKTDLHFSSSSLTWVMNAYLIAFGSFLLLGGRLGDLIGRTRMFLVGIAIFTGASVLCGVASSEAMLIGARFVQGFGAAAAASAILALIVVEFPDARERVRAMSAYTFVSVAGGSIGLIAGGLLTQALNWHWIFFINVPLGAIAFLAGRATLDHDRGLGLGQHVDVLGSVLITAAAMIGIYAIVGSEDHGLLSARTLGLAGVAAVLLGAFLAVERRVASPILPLEIMRLRSLMVACGVRALMVCGMWATFFVRRAVPRARARHGTGRRRRGVPAPDADGRGVLARPDGTADRALRRAADAAVRPDGAGRGPRAVRRWSSSRARPTSRACSRPTPSSASARARRS